jgi:3-isopropylmalate dehydrogenase
MGAVLSGGLMLECLGFVEEARAVEAAVRRAVVDRCGTRDIGGALGTRETGDWIAREVRSQKLEVGS